MSDRVIFTGGRDYHDWDAVSTLVKALPDNVTVVVGDAKGADFMVRKAAKDRGLTVEEHKAEWEKYGKKAGPIRNQKMVDGGAYLCVAFPGGDGTEDCVRRAHEAGIPVKRAMRA